MKATYKDHVIEATKGGNGLYTATIDGKPAEVEPSTYRRVVIRRAVQALQEREVKEIEKP